WYDCANQIFNTATRRLCLYIESPKPRLDWGEEFDPERFHFAFFEPPHEAWPVSVGGYAANPLAQKYPLLFQSSHCRWRTHTTFGNVAWLNELQPEPVISINPDDAAARNIHEGDMVRAFNDRGHVVLRARIDAAMRPGTVNVPHGWQRGQFVEGHYGDLCSEYTEIFDANENYYDCLCEVVLNEEA
ncbi:MAG: hypothetical protein IJJ14_06845, partial [Coriobacteriales bacterium]|nr:hypothetical protein [Coriobacteriales bacterium]